MTSGLGLDERKGSGVIENPKPVWDYRQFRQYVPPSGFIFDYLQYATLCTDAHPLYHILAASAVSSTAVSPHLDLYHHNEMHPLHMFFLIVGSSSESRKTSAIKRVARLADPVFQQICQTANRVWWPQLASPEGIFEELAREPNRLMCLSEWTEMHRLTGGKSGYWSHSNESMNLLYDAETMHRARAKDQSMKVERPRVSILGASTPALIEDATTRVDWLGGKLARYLIGYASRPPNIEMEASADYPYKVAALQEKLLVMCRPVPDMTRLTLSSAAWEIMRQWRRDEHWRDMRERAPEHIGPSFSRAQEHAFRLSAIYECSYSFPWRSEISPECMLAAISLIEWCYDAMCKTFATTHDQDKSGVTKVISILASVGSKGMTRSALLRRGKLTAKHLSDILVTLEQRGEVRHEQYTTDGRAGVRYWYVKPRD